MIQCQEDYRKALSLVKTTNDSLNAAIEALVSLMDRKERYVILALLAVLSDATTSLHVKMAAANALIKLSKNLENGELASIWCVQDYMDAATVQTVMTASLGTQM